MKKITPFLWFDGRVAEAMEHYQSIFPGLRVVRTVPGPAGTLSAVQDAVVGSGRVVLSWARHGCSSGSPSNTSRTRAAGRS